MSHTLTFVYSDGRENPWDPAEVERRRLRVIDELLEARDRFVFRNQDRLLDALGVTAADAGDPPEPIHATSG